VQVDVFIQRENPPNTDPLIFDVRPTVGGVPVESDVMTLATRTLQPSEVPTTAGFVSIDIRSFNVQVQVGDVLAIALREPGDPDTDYSWKGRTDNQYARGIAYFRSTAFPFWGPPGGGNYDLGFRTWVESGFAWKQDWPDFAPSGMPDFSQDHSGHPPTYCGPTAVADALWWLDSEFEGRCPTGAPGDGVDDHPLVRKYAAATDDHSADNVRPLIEALRDCMNTDDVLGMGSGHLGTFSDDMAGCLGQWLAAAKLSNRYVIERFFNPDPSFGELACSVERSKAAILLLGFYWQDGGGTFHRLGGHFVTVAGASLARDPGVDQQPGVAGFDDDTDGKVDEDDELCPCGDSGPVVYGDDVCGNPSGQAEGQLLAISDPDRNTAELLGTGRVRGPGHGNHAPSVTPPPDHDDSQNLSHDGMSFGHRPRVNPVGPPFNALYGYSTDGESSPFVPCADVEHWTGQNPPGDTDLSMPCPTPDTQVIVEIDEVILIAPKASPICIDVQLGQSDLRVHKGVCPSPAFFVDRDYIRGELCQVTEIPPTVDLGHVDCLEWGTAQDQLPDDTTPDITSGIGAWFFLSRDHMIPDGPWGVSSSGSNRVAGSGDCP
jgi:hypothetical protein